MHIPNTIFSCISNSELIGFFLHKTEEERWIREIIYRINNDILLQGEVLDNQWFHIQFLAMHYNLTQEINISKLKAIKL